MSKQLIVNADDYGHTPGVSNGIRRAHLKGIVSSTTVMMTWPHVAEALVTAKRECSELGMGLHLVLTAGKPVLPAECIPGLVGVDGGFRELDDLIAHLADIHPDEVLAEWRAQVKAFTTVTGYSPDHLDSHHHFSYFSPALFECMLILAQELDCPIRKPFGDDFVSFADHLPGETAFAYAGQISDLLNRYRPRYPEVFFGRFFDTGVTRENLEAILFEIKNDPCHTTFELMCHPAMVDEELSRDSSYVHPRSLELSLLQNSQIKALLVQYDINLIRFLDLA